MKRRRLLAGAIGLGTLGLTPAMLARGPRLQMFSGADLAFGAVITIQVLHEDQRQAEIAIQAALAAAKNIDRLMSLHRPDSQLAQLNRDGILPDPDPHLRTVLAYASQLSRQSGGAFDVTVQPLWQAYSAAAARGALPSAGERRAAMALVDWRQVASDAQQVKLHMPGMALTLNGIAQGYAVDVARAVLLAHGIRHALLDTGEFAAHGRAEEQRRWQVGVRDPRDPAALATVLPIDERCMATSGDYETVFTPDFAHHHIFDPALGDSPPQLASVTVLAPTGLQADGLSTTLMVLGATRAMALVAGTPGVDALLIAKDGRRWQTAGLPQSLA